MIVVYAEKPDVGTKIAAALGNITLDNGTIVGFQQIAKYEKAIKVQRRRDGFFKTSFLGQEFFVTWGFGHLCELKQAVDYNEAYKSWQNIPLPFIPTSYELKLKKEALPQYKVIKDLFDKADLILCATDSDREGDLIFYYLYSYMKCKKPFKRALFDKHSEEEYKKAFSPKNLIEGKERKPVIEAGIARSQSDFIVGANLTVAATLRFFREWSGNFTDKRPFSVGRVQTVVLRMLVDRENAIKNFVSEPFYTIKALFTTEDDQMYEGKLNKKFKSQKEAQDLLNHLNQNPQAFVEEVEVQETTLKKPNLFSLDTLQITANKAYGFSLDYTLNLAQELYEQGYITYPRTDSMFLPEDMLQEMKDVLRKLKGHKEYARLFAGAEGDIVNPKMYFDSNKVSSHYAIVPTTKEFLGDGDQKKLYNLIAISVATMQHNNATMLREIIHTKVGDITFSSSGTSVKKAGFLSATGIPKDSYLPLVKEGDKVRAEYKREDKKTTPPVRYTDETILKAMINCGKEITDKDLKAVLMKTGQEGSPLGIGRPSTRAAILSTLEMRGYLVRNKKALLPTPKGMFLVEKLPIEDIKNPELTAKWEDRLDDIANNKDSLSSFMADMEDIVRKWTQQMVEKVGISSQTGEDKSSPFSCPVCGKALYPAKKGGYYCKGFYDDSCNFYLGKIGDRALTDQQCKALLEGRKIELLGLVSKKTQKPYDVSVSLEADGSIKFSFPRRKKK